MERKLREGGREGERRGELASPKICSRTQTGDHGSLGTKGHQNRDQISA